VMVEVQQEPAITALCAERHTTSTLDERIGDSPDTTRIQEAIEVTIDEHFEPNARKHDEVRLSYPGLAMPLAQPSLSQVEPTVQPPAELSFKARPPGPAKSSKSSAARSARAESETLPVTVSAVVPVLRQDSVAMTEAVPEIWREQLAREKPSDQRVQVLLDHGWSEFPPDASKQLQFNLEDGITKFGMKMHGALYAIEICGQEGTQTNAKTGKVRRLRVVRSNNETTNGHDVGFASKTSSASGRVSSRPGRIGGA
jgi:hypothetical protein